METHELVINIEGCDYSVIVDFSKIWVDDSFSHEFGVRVCGHWELDHCSIARCYDENGSDVEISSIPGLEATVRDYMIDEVKYA